MRSIVESIAERVTGRPRLVRDRVLAATSTDGLVWRKENSRPITHPAHRRSHMTYFTAFDSAGRLWVRASLHDRVSDGWYTELGRGRGWIDVRRFGLQHFYAPQWHGDRLYGVAIERGGGPSSIACFATDSDAAPSERVAQEWEDIDTFPVVHDLALVQSSGTQLDAFVSAGSGEAEIAVHHWHSADGTHWQHLGRAVESPFRGNYRLANNPAVVALDDGSWRMYYRTGERVVLGNAIRSARSDDLAAWKYEEGVRVAPGGRWDPHGLGFPHVWHEADAGLWRMLYAGYWGEGDQAATTVAHWERTAAGMEGR